jgi:nucleoside-diphosphate-sugar epimerase
VSKTVVVTGGAGYIGAVLVRMLVEQDWKVRVVDRLYWGEKPIAPVLDKLELFQQDVRSMCDDVLQGADAVIHLAGLSNDPTAEMNPEANRQMNAVATRALAEACKRVGVERLSYGSSCSIYDGLPVGPVYDETADVQPKGAYATSKYEGEEALLEHADDNFSPIILRQGTVYGASPRMRFDLVVNTFVKAAVQNGELQIHGGGWMWRPLVDVKDVARAHIACLEAPRDSVHAQVFNVVHDNFQIRGLAMLVAGSAQMRKYRPKLKDAPLPKLVRDYKCDNSKLRNAIGFTPGVTILESVEEMLLGIEKNGYIDFNHPRYYNIAWMTLLDELHPYLARFPSVF